MKVFKFPCDRTVKVSEAEWKRCMFLGGYFEFCLHHCPVGKNVNECHKFGVHHNRISDLKSEYWKKDCEVCPVCASAVPLATGECLKCGYGEEDY